MKKDSLHYTAFFDETGSITNDTLEVFGGSLFIIENSEIDQCRKFLKECYPSGIHCKELSKRKLSIVAEEIGNFLENKNCCAVTAIQINKNLLKDYKLLFYEKNHYQLTSKDLSLLKRYWNFSAIPRLSLFGVFNLVKKQTSKKVIITIFMENVVRNEKMDRWDLYLESLNGSFETFKSNYFTNNVEVKNFVKNVEIKTPESKTKKGEIMFSFSDLFVYSIRRIITHREYALYNKLKHIFEKSGHGYCSEPELFKKYPNGVFIQYLKAEELFRLYQLSKKEWYKELKYGSSNVQS